MSKVSFHLLWLVALLAPVGIHAGESDNRLAEAVKNHDKTTVSALLKQRGDVNAPEADGATALHWATHLNDLETADLLIRAGANVNAVNRYGATPLLVACTNGNVRMIERLLEAGAAPNGRSIGGEPPILTAAAAGSVEAVKALVAYGADVNARESWRGQTALMWAVGNKHLAVAEALIEKRADVSARSNAGYTALAFSVRQGDLESTRVLINAGANVNEPMAGGKTALAVAINNGYHGLATFLLDNGADPNRADTAGNTALHVAVQKRANGLESADRARWLELMKMMLGRGANPNARTAKSVRVPRIAGPRPAIDTVQLEGVTPIWLAAKEVDLEAIRLLHANGADPLIPSVEDTTPLLVAAGLGYLEGIGRKQAGDDRILEVLTLLLQWGNHIDASNQHGQTAVHGAAYGASPAVIQFLVDHGAKIDEKDAIGRTPFQVAEDNKLNKYRTNQDLDPTRVESTWILLRQLSGQTRLK